jgi:succinate dehydrogenase flavin-adding protein (antitoxin of CptAB toxin-antitoxin module)
MNLYQKNKLHWNCRRGLLELDLILERFLKTNPTEKEFVELLDLPDNDLLDIVMGRSDAYGPHLNDLVARLRAA